MKIWTEPFGLTLDGVPVTKYFLRNAAGTCVALTDFGATLLSLTFDGRDVVLGYDSLREYETQTEYLGATVGRFAGTVPYGLLRLGEKTLPLSRNIDGHCIHGGFRGFSFRVWDARLLEDGICFRLLSPDGEEGFPGNLQVSATFRLTEESGLHIVYDALADQDTVCNMTCHGYFNLEGHGHGSALEHILWLPATHFRVDTPEGVHTPRLFSAEGTPFDFRVPHPLGRDLQQPHDQLDPHYGYDRNAWLGAPGQWKQAAVITAPGSGITLQVTTTQSGMQLYCPGYLLEGHPAKEIGTYRGYGGFCLETQHCLSPEEAAAEQLYPVLPAGRPYHMETIYQFTKEKLI